MFNTVADEVWAFDAEWIPDPKAGRLRLTVNLVLELVLPYHLRLDRLLASILDISRTQLQRWFVQGRIGVYSANSLRTDSLSR